MRHPDVLRYLDGIETEQSIMFVTDPIEPLSSQLNQDPDKNLVIWGLYKVANAIKFLNNDCDMVHGSVKIASIFTNKAGEWKLGGFELLCSMKEESPIILTFGGLVPDAQRYATPEVKKSGWTAIKDLPAGAIDSYHLGCLVYEAYNHRFESTDSLISQKGTIPVNMQRVYTSLLNPSFKSRATADTFLDEGLRPKGFFSNDFIKVNLFLENISIKEQSEKEGFFRKLDSSIETFPSEFSKHKILPELIKAFEFGSGGAKALSAIVKVGDHLSTEEYQAVIIEPIIRMFSSPDRAIRVSLLENMPKFIDHMTNKMVTTQVFPNIATGFTDTIPIIREQTIKSILLLVPKLNERIVNYDLLKYLAKLQMDPEPGIRTNTTICLGKIAKYLSDSTRRKVLVPAFTRSLRDGFFHARIAALMALNATSEYYDAQECATRIIPAVSLVLVDKEKPVRDQAFKVINFLINKVQDFAEKMPVTAIIEQSDTPVPEDIAAQGASMSGVFGGATKGLAGWAVSSIQSRFASPNGEIENPIGSPSPASIESHKAAKPTQQSSLAMSNQLGMQTIEADEAIGNDNDGWDEEDNTDFGFNQPEEVNTTWDNFEKPATPSSPLPVHATPVSSFGAYGNSGSKAQGSMKLGHKPKVNDLDLLDDDSSEINNAQYAAEIPSRDSPANKDDRKAELERRREERRQRMAELREKKKGGIASCIVLPLATKTTSLSQTTTEIAGTPTTFSLSKRADEPDEDNLDLYQNWASMCRGQKDDKNIAMIDTDDPSSDTDNLSLNNLWKTVTETVNCGGGHAITVTKTTTISPTSKPRKPSSQKKACTGQCWSDYLWHTYGDSISPAQGFAGIVCIIFGLYFSILGYRFFRPTLGLVGFVFFATMTWIGLINNEPAGGWPLGDLIYICVSTGLGILGAFMFMFFYQVGVYLLAALGGFYFAVYFLSWNEDLVITIKVARVCFIIGVNILGTCVLYFIETYMVIFSTSLMGSYLFYFGLDFFAHTGFINPWLLIFDGNANHHNTYLMNKPVHVMLGFVIVNTLISFGWQYYWNIIIRKSPGFGRAPLEEVPEEKKEEKKEEPPNQFVCMPPPYYQPQPMFMQNVCA
ncbi:hypothetical protein BDF21DRAFT_370083 [Thamnidium elegans]|nr:hypothetical protein BDF21DRAFT_370083 [Thamnidium elegans]